MSKTVKYTDHVEMIERAELSATATDANGCVICPSTTPNGPTCGKGYEKLLRSPTCNQCAEYYCEKTSVIDGTSTPVGAIVGGVVGGVVALIVAGLLYYFLIWRKKHPSLDYDDDIPMSDLEMEGEDKGSFSNDSGEINDHSSQNISFNDDGNGSGSNNISGNGSGSGTGTANATAGGSSSNGGAAGAIRPGNRRNNSGSNLNTNKRLSSYESFTRPQKVGGRRNNGQIRGKPIGKRQLKNKRLINNSNLTYGNNNMNNMNGTTINSPYLNPNSSNRNSIATTISTTNASNILPIAYIPGVTVRPTKNNTKSIYSYETDSIFSDLNTIENASIIGDIMRANYQPNNNMDINEDDEHELEEQDGNGNGNGNGSGSGNGNGSGNGSGAGSSSGEGKSTMTAIKAHPRLVSVDKIDEEDEDEEYYEELSDDDEGFNDSKKGSINTTTHQLNDSTLSTVTINNIQDSSILEDEDLDVDSDIGEIQRATSIRRNQAKIKEVNENQNQNKNQSQNQNQNKIKEIPIDLIDLGKPVKETDSINDGSFVLDVEIDKRESQTSGEKSPFEDP